MDAASFLVRSINSRLHETLPSVSSLVASGTDSLPFPPSLRDTWRSNAAYRFLDSAKTCTHRRYGVIHLMPTLGNERLVSLSGKRLSLDRLSLAIGNILLDGVTSTYAIKDIWSFKVYGESPRNPHYWLELVKIVPTRIGDFPRDFPRGSTYQIEGQEVSRQVVLPVGDDSEQKHDNERRYEVDWTLFTPGNLQTKWKPLKEVTISETIKGSARLYQGGLYWTTMDGRT